MCIRDSFCYDPSQDKWTDLPPLPVRWFGLGQVNGKLVAVGGKTNRDNRHTNEVYTYNEQARKWKQTPPPMPTARRDPSVVSLQSALVVAGGFISSAASSGEALSTCVVEIFKPATSQWYRTDPLPAQCLCMSLVAIGNTFYALGGDKSSDINYALHASVDDLLRNAVPVNQTTHSSNSDTQSAWKTLPNTPTYRPVAAMLAGNLLAIGGHETSKEGVEKKEVYMYSSSTNSWIYISDLPAPQARSIVATLSSMEILVIGGYGDGGNVNTVYSGTLTMNA